MQVTEALRVARYGNTRIPVLPPATITRRSASTEKH
jgi:hypothetical protein